MYILHTQCFNSEQQHCRYSVLDRFKLSPPNPQTQVFSATEHDLLIIFHIRNNCLGTYTGHHISFFILKQNKMLPMVVMHSGEENLLDSSFPVSTTGNSASSIPMGNLKGGHSFRHMVLIAIVEIYIFLRTRVLKKISFQRQCQRR